MSAGGLYCTSFSYITDLAVDACCDGADLSGGSVDGEHIGNGDVRRLAEDAVVHEPIRRGAVVGVKGRYLHYRSAYRGRRENKRKSKHSCMHNRARVAQQLCLFVWVSKNRRTHKAELFNQRSKLCLPLALPERCPNITSNPTLSHT